MQAVPKPTPGLLGAYQGGTRSSPVRGPARAQLPPARFPCQARQRLMSRRPRLSPQVDSKQENGLAKLVPKPRTPLFPLLGHFIEV